METELSYELAINTTATCKEYQNERKSGRLYITQTGLNKVARAIGGDYKTLTKKQKAEFRMDCVNAVMDYQYCIKTWWYYINI